MHIDILVDSPAFWDRLKDDILSAKDHIYLQTLSFEGDRVGEQLCQALLSTTAPDIRVLVDSYTRFILSDRFVYSPKALFDPALRQEAKETTRMLAELQRAGVRIKFTNDFGWLLKNCLDRNHKKLIVVDHRVAYIGGINFSEHNFDWHDMMLRIADEEVAEFLRDDFLSTWSGRNLSGSRNFDGLEFHIFDGQDNESTYNRLLDVLAGAEQHIFVHSPYLTFPFWEPLREARRRGVSVTVVTPEANNRKFMGDYIQWESARSDVDLRLYENGMTHLKAMLVDDRFLIVGSSNFDILSYRKHQEIVAIVTTENVIQQFKESVVQKDLAVAAPFDGRLPMSKKVICRLGCKVAEWVLAPSWTNGVQ